jgi:guanine deaminase
MIEEDVEFMREAIRLSREGMRQGLGGPFGAVVVREGKIVGRGRNEVTSTYDPTAHGEIVAIRDAGRNLKSFDLSECSIYTSCEPCPMCLCAIYWARIGKILYANSCADAAEFRFDDGSFYQELSRPPEARAIPMAQLLRDEAYPVFQEWLAKGDRVPY